MHDNRDGEPLDRPKVIAQVVFPDADGSVFGQLRIDDPAELDLGMPVQIVPSTEPGAPGILFKPLA